MQLYADKYSMDNALTAQQKEDTKKKYEQSIVNFNTFQDSEPNKASKKVLEDIVEALTLLDTAQENYVITFRNCIPDPFKEELEK